MEVWGKSGKYREVPLNSTVQEPLSERIAELPRDAPCLPPSRKGRKPGAGGARESTPITDRARIHRLQVRGAG
ncbi:MAG TPA: hypothetical protein VE225_09510 [Rubrobacteraceae bacterium]|nr:hypothetical protein [Rubrobacteraceae bacterium]